LHFAARPRLQRQGAECRTLGEFQAKALHTSLKRPDSICRNVRPEAHRYAWAEAKLPAANASWRERGGHKLHAIWFLLADIICSVIFVAEAGETQHVCCLRAPEAQFPNTVGHVVQLLVEWAWHARAKATAELDTEERVIHVKGGTVPMGDQRAILTPGACCCSIRGPFVVGCVNVRGARWSAVSLVVFDLTGRHLANSCR
jgi:hypothetical protein